MITNAEIFGRTNKNGGHTEGISGICSRVRQHARYLQDPEQKPIRCAACRTVDYVLRFLSKQFATQSNTITRPCLLKTAQETYLWKGRDWSNTRVASLYVGVQDPPTQAPCIVLVTSQLRALTGASALVPVKRQVLMAAKTTPANQILFHGVPYGNHHNYSSNSKKQAVQPVIVRKEYQFITYCSQNKGGTLLCIILLT